MAAPVVAVVETLTFRPAWSDPDTARIEWRDTESVPIDEIEESLWPHTPFGDDLLMNADEWRLRGDPSWTTRTLHGDYNRVDRLQLSVGGELHPSDHALPRIGARFGYSFGRKRTLYGVRFEQPLLPNEWLAVGASMDRRTAHPDLQQIPDWENSLDLLFGRNDHRNYFERSGIGAYATTRLGDLTTASLHVRNDEYASLALEGGVTSILWRERELRANPEIDPGEVHTWALQLERLARRKVAPRAGIYHWLSLERAGHGLGGEFEYTRLLGDLRTVLRLSPATTLAVRLAAGHTLEGTLPAQRRFTLGGVDALRAHNAATFEGDRIALAQAEYTFGLWRFERLDGVNSDLSVIVFADAGSAWSGPGHDWNLGDQRVAIDGGFGIGTGDETLRVYFARDLREPAGPFNVTARLQRPF
ncbi:MAG: BamA/TamA family outer membrane protein [Candidatus Eisenbacteria bacterium]|uniref:BamA/TamA family outer membrane protein n=1 Tax=Eiseniibacteriota bacterium TaxID=2212470 RepID=A0A849SM19_UNCEI|nr:BamA/TamA family outer membrane protein [Candidatus Eisenbacteria bacterium]